MNSARTTCHIALVGAVLLAGCQAEERAASGRSMSAPATAADTARADRPNEAPRIASLTLEPDDARPGQLVQAHASVGDADGDPTHLRYTWRANGDQLAEKGGSLVMPPLEKGATLEVEAIASDGRAESAPAYARVRVGNTAPAIASVHFDRASELRAGDSVLAVVEADDADGDAVTLAYRWSVNGRRIETADDANPFDTKGLHRGDEIAVSVVASDGDDDSESFDAPSLVLGNAAPRITSTPPPTMGADGVYRYAVEASDPDRDRGLRFSLTTAPEGARVDPIGGEITWSPTFQQAGTHAIEVAVSDGHGGDAKQRFEVTVKEVEGAGGAQPPANEAP